MVLPIRMGWRHLLFANWPVDPSAVATQLPDALDVETYDGRAWLSAVPFTNVAVRPAGVPRRLGFRLPELNLRTYVTHDGEPGVYFFSLDAHGVTGVVGARILHQLPYYYARMSLEAEEGTVDFESRRRHPGARSVDFTATYGPAGGEFVAEPGSLAAFLTDRDRYYAESASGDVCHADVHHGPWPLYSAEATVEGDSLFRANGFERPDGEPVCYYSPGVDTVASPSGGW